MSKATIEWDGVKMTLEFSPNFVYDKEMLQEMLYSCAIGCGFQPKTVGKTDE